MKLSEAFEQRLLRKIPINKDKVTTSLKTSEKFLSDANNLLNKNIYNFVIVDSARKQRHQGLYGVDYEFEKEDCEHIISVAKKFNKKVKEFLHSK